MKTKRDDDNEMKKSKRDKWKYYTFLNVIYIWRGKYNSKIENNMEQDIPNEPNAVIFNLRSSIV